MRFLFTICASVFLLAPASLPALAQNKPASPKQQNKQKWIPPRIPPSQQLQRLLEASPEEREQFLSQLPPAQRANRQAQLERLESLPPEQRARRLRLLDIMENLPPDRRQAVTQEITSITAMRFVERRARLHSREFEQSYTAPELELIRSRFEKAAQ